jgi:hypothetical protein
VAHHAELGGGEPEPGVLTRSVLARDGLSTGRLDEALGNLPERLLLALGFVEPESRDSARAAPLPKASCSSGSRSAAAASNAHADRVTASFQRSTRGCWFRRAN